MIRWPTRKDYDSALRNTSASFRSPEIQTSRVVHHGLGSIFSTGKFACISKVEIEGKFWALRFVLTDQPAIQDRYRAIQQMSDALRPYFVETHFSKTRSGSKAKRDTFLSSKWNGSRAPLSGNSSTRPALTKTSFASNGFDKSYVNFDNDCAISKCHMATCLQTIF